MNRYVTVHGHFYQPPRENPWTGEVDEELTARPYHDWNERITAECYAPNGPNYSRMSFNFGPTLLAWLEANASDAYAAILAADRESRDRFSGHGSAIAQAYNHAILPLANRRDKVTQVVWGIRDFEFRFGRRPEGMWLPET
ncbi:MAG TPA: glycoside hydrolase, partial [Thermoanaerobaculia bacterium]|nr:glycoside hydrolase [Thermoanaerobaculia bacterium]